MKKSLCIFLFAVFAACKSSIPISAESPELQLSAGSIDRYSNFPSEHIPPRNVDVWLPESYPLEGEYQVLYMHDGQMLFNAATTWNRQEWGVDETLQRLMDKDSIAPTIVVAIWNSGENRHAEYFPQKPFMALSEEVKDAYIKENEKKKGLFSNTVYSDAYLKFIVEELKPFIDKKYSTHEERESTFIAGSSMGGLISWYAVAEYPQIFGGAAALSTHWPGIFVTEDNPVPQEFLAYLNNNLPARGEHKFYFDYGTATLDAVYETYQLQVDSLMRSKNYSAENWKTLKFEGADHSENSWKARLEVPVKFLLKK